MNALTDKRIATLYGKTYETNLIGLVSFYAIYAVAASLLLFDIFGAITPHYSTGAIHDVHVAGAALALVLWGVFALNKRRVDR